MRSSSLPTLSSASSHKRSGLEILSRYDEGRGQYIKLTLQDGVIVGAMLIGETGMEETLENLMLNRTDVSSFGMELLNPDIDVEDYFD